MQVAEDQDLRCPPHWAVNWPGGRPPLEAEWASMTLGSSPPLSATLESQPGRGTGVRSKRNGVERSEIRILDSPLIYSVTPCSRLKARLTIVSSADVPPAPPREFVAHGKFLRDGEVGLSRLAHNQQIVSSNLTPGTKSRMAIDFTQLENRN